MQNRSIPHRLVFICIIKYGLGAGWGLQAPACKLIILLYVYELELIGLKSAREASNTI